MRDGDIVAEKPDVLHASDVVTTTVDRVEDLLMALRDRLPPFGIATIDDHIVGIFGERRREPIAVAGVPARFDNSDCLADSMLLRCAVVGHCSLLCNTLHRNKRYTY